MVAVPELSYKNKVITFKGRKDGRNQYISGSGLYLEPVGQRIAGMEASINRIGQHQRRNRVVYIRGEKVKNNIKHYGRIVHKFIDGQSRCKLIEAIRLSRTLSIQVCWIRHTRILDINSNGKIPTDKRLKDTKQ